MIITISGMPGSGKSTVARRLSEQLAYKRYYMGAVRRKAARKLGMTLEEFNKKGETDASTDLFVEEYIQKLARLLLKAAPRGRLSLNPLKFLFTLTRAKARTEF